MRAVAWYGPEDMRVVTVPEPKILNPHDAIIRVTTAAICGSDLHIYDGYIPGMERGDILGHEFVGEVVEVGKEVTNLKPGDRVVVPFPISCGQCYYCQHNLWSLCDNTNPNAWMVERMWGHSPAGIYGYSHLLGGYAGGQAEYVRVPFANVGPLKLPDGVTDEQAVMLADVFPTGYQAAENCGIQSGDVVAVFGCGPVGQFAILSAHMLGADHVIAVDRVPERLMMAARNSKVETINYEQQDVVSTLNDMTGGRGPDACIEAVGMEAHGTGLDALYDKVEQTLRLETGRATALRYAMLACRKGGTLSLAGAFGGFVDKIPIGAVMNKGLQLRTGQTHVHRYLRPLLKRIQNGEIDPSFIVTHRMGLEEAPHGYRIFRDKQDDCVKVVLKPQA